MRVSLVTEIKSSLWETRFIEIGRLSSGVETTRTLNLHNTLLLFLDEHVAAPVVVVGVGRERGQNGPEEP